MSVANHFGDLARTLLAAEHVIQAADEEKYVTIISSLQKDIDKLADELGGNFEKLRLRLAEPFGVMLCRAVTEVPTNFLVPGDTCKTLCCYIISPINGRIFLGGLGPDLSKEFPLENGVLSDETRKQMIGDLITAAFNMQTLSRNDLEKLAAFSSAPSAQASRVDSTGGRAADDDYYARPIREAERLVTAFGWCV